jgi:hypothetical protein
MKIILFFSAVAAAGMLVLSGCAADHGSGSAGGSISGGGSASGSVSGSR